MPLNRIHICLLLLFSGFIYGQNGLVCDPGWNIKPTYNHGFILEHRSTIGHLVKGYPDIYELNIGKPTCGHALWHFENNKPDIGVSLSVIDFKNPSQLGYACSMAPYAEIPLNQAERQNRVVMRLCWGLTYITKPYDVHANPKNIAIGSHFNSFVQFKWFWHLKINERLRFEPGFSFTHTSNARAKVPNLGLNVVTLNAGLNYLLHPKHEVCKRPDTSRFTRSKNEFLVYAAFGINQREVATPDLLCTTVSMEYHRNVRNTHKFGASVNVFADKHYVLDFEELEKRKPNGAEQLRASVMFCYSYNLGRVSFPFETGYYVYQKSNPDGYIVSRIGIKYYSRSGLVASVGLRTHFAVAYNFEYGIGYRIFFKDKK